MDELAEAVKEYAASALTIKKKLEACNKSFIKFAVLRI